MIFESHTSLCFAAACLVSRFVSSMSPLALCHSERSREWSNRGERHGRLSREVAARESGDERVQISNFFLAFRPIISCFRWVRSLGRDVFRRVPSFGTIETSSLHVVYSPMV